MTDYYKNLKIPDCYGEFVCPDDCVVSCPIWEDCMMAREELQEEYEREYDEYLERMMDAILAFQQIFNNGTYEGREDYDLVQELWRDKGR